MADNTFKVKYGITLKPTDPTNIIDPKDGDLIVDINDNNLKKYDESVGDFEEISGSGGSVLPEDAVIVDPITIDILNNQLDWVDIEEFELLGDNGKLSIILHRETDSDSIDSNITLSYIYSRDLDEYDITVSYAGNPSGLTFDIDKSKTLRYKSNELLGNDYEGTAIVNHLAGLVVHNRHGFIREVITEPTIWTAPEGVSEIEIYTKYTKFRLDSINAGYNHSLAIDNLGQAWSWGYGDVGALGDGTTDNKCVPVQVCGGHCFTQISAGVFHSLAIDHQGQAWAWGDGGNGTLGDGTTDNKCVPVQVCGGHCFTQIIAGYNHSLAIDHQGQAWAWGNGVNGQLGDGTVIDKCVPVQVCGDHCFVQISAEVFHSLAIDYQGQAWSWGYGTDGQLGDGTTGDKCVPVQVCGDHCFVQISAGHFHSLAINHQGQAWSWGCGDGGRLGDGTVIDKCVPVQVCGGHCFVQVSAGGEYSLAIDHQGQAWSWGYETDGQLGNGSLGHGTVFDKCVPVQVCGDHCFTQVNAGGNHSLALDNQGQAWSWGRGDDGQLGDGTTGSKCVPVSVCKMTLIPHNPDFSQGDSISTSITVVPGQSYCIDPYGTNGETRMFDGEVLNYNYAAKIIIEYIK